MTGSSSPNVNGQTSIDHAILQNRPMWCIDHAYSIGHTVDDSGRGIVPSLDTKEYPSVDKAVKALNAGTVSCPNGLCIVRSERQKLYFLVARSDKLHECANIARDVLNVKKAEQSFPGEIDPSTPALTATASVHQEEVAVEPPEAENIADPRSELDFPRIEEEEEIQQVEIDCETPLIGSTGLLKDVAITRKTMQAQSRESMLLEKILAALPVHREWILKHGRSKCAGCCGLGNKFKLCVLQDGHFIWWDKQAPKKSDKARGCLNFLVHQAEIITDPARTTIFTIRPSQPSGWQHATTFGGGAQRQFTFDVADCEVSRDEWVGAIQSHIDFGNWARQYVGETALLGLQKPSFSIIS